MKLTEKAEVIQTKVDILTSEINNTFDILTSENNTF